MNIILPGQYPRSEALVRATRQWDRNQISQEALHQIHLQDVASLQKLQEGFRYITTGLFHWQDLLRPFAEIIENSESATLIRFFETNLFWRQLKCRGDLRFDESKWDEWIETWFFSQGFYSKETPLIFTFPFLYLFQTYSSGISLDEICRIFFLVIEKLAKFPNKLFCFFEPTIGWRELSNREKELGIVFLKRIREMTKDPIFFNTAFFRITKESHFLSQLPVDGLGVDFYANSLQEVESWFPKDKILIAGILNTESTRIESEEQFTPFIHSLGKSFAQDRVYFMPNGVSELLPRVVMDEKIEALKNGVA